MSFYDHFDDYEQSVLRERAQRTAEQDADEDESFVGIEVLTVTLGGETYGLPLRSLTAAYQVNVNLNTPVVPVPCTPRYIAGIANIRGHVVPVIDLPALLGLSPNVETTGIVVVANEQTTMAFRIDRIGDTVQVRLSDLIPVSELFDLANTDYLQGTLTDGTILLDVEAILADPALVVDESVG